MISKKILATISLVVAISVTIVTPVFATNSDIHLLSDTSKPSYTKLRTDNFAIQKK